MRKKLLKNGIFSGKLDSWESQKRKVIALDKSATFRSLPEISEFCSKEHESKMNSKY